MDDTDTLVTPENLTIAPLTDETISTTLYSASSTKTISEVVNMHLLYGYAAFGSSAYTYATDPDMDHTDGSTNDARTH